MQQGAAITGTEVDENGDLIITFSDSSAQNAGKVKGEDGKNGAGADTENPLGLDFYPLPDGTYAVSAGKAIYLGKVTIPATYKGKAVTCIGLPEGFDDDAAEMGSVGAGFAYASNLKSIHIPNSIKRIGDIAFRDCSNLTAVYYGGTADNWGNIYIGSYNDNLTFATLYYYSATEPTAAGNYWHYVNGQITVWPDAAE